MGLNCQFCGIPCEDMDELQLHQTMICKSVGEQDAMDNMDKEEENDMKDLISHFQDLTVADLRAELRKRGLQYDGRKEDLKRKL